MVSKKPKKYLMPDYSLTGDILSFLTCRLQYRFNNMGKLPLSKPVQQWFGEFIHGVMEEGYLRWREGELTFPCTFEDVQPISVEIANRLRAKGLMPNYLIFAYKDRNDKKCSQLLANRRAFESIYTWGPDLFPLISRNEIKLEGMRNMPDYTPGISRSEHYTVTGVADVISSVKISEVDNDNRIVRLLKLNPRINEMLNSSDEFEVIIDYKGMLRPPCNNEKDRTWDYHRWQLDTYLWLRRLQLDSEGKDHPILAGIVLYLNETYLSKSDMNKVIDQTINGQTDVPSDEFDLGVMADGKQPSKKLRMNRSIRIIPYDENEIRSSLERFDSVVKEIETCIRSESSCSGNIIDQWSGNTYLRERCVACDFRNICKDAPKDIEKLSRDEADMLRFKKTED